MKSRSICKDCIHYIEYNDNSGWCTRCNNITKDINTCRKYEDEEESNR